MPQRVRAVTITAVDNAVDSPDKMVRVSGTVSSSEADAPDGRDFDNHRRGVTASGDTVADTADDQRERWG